MTAIALHHPLAALAILAAAIAAFCCGLAALFDHIDDRLDTRQGIRHLEHYANHPANRSRKENP